MSVITARPLTAVPLTARPLTAYALGASAGGAVDPLVWHAATYDPVTFECKAQLVGAGTPTFTSSAMLLPDHQGVYVSVSANTAPWHGARWSGGVPYADNGSGVLLNPVPSLYGAPAYTNSLTYSNDLTNAAWTKTNCTAALDAAGITGSPSTASTLTATAANATCIHSAVTAASGTHTTNWRIKRKTGTGTIEITVDNGTTWQDVTSLIDSTDFNECMESLTVTNPQIGIRIVTSGDAVYVGNSSCHLTKTEAQVRGSAPIVTAASTVTTSAVLMKYSPANHADGQGAYYCEGTQLSISGTYSMSYIISQSSGRIISETGAGVQTTFDGTTVVTLGGAATQGVASKYGVAYDAGKLKKIGYKDGVMGTEGAYDGSYAMGTEIVLAGASGAASAATVPVLIRNVRRYDLDYTAAKAKLTELMS